MKKLLPALVAGIVPAFLLVLNLVAISPAAAQSEGDPPPDVDPPPIPVASSATIDFGSDTITQPGKYGTTFGEVALEPGQTVTITLQYDAALSGQGVIVESLDGGQIIAFEQGLLIDQDGLLSFQFHAQSDPGFCRILTHQEGDGDTLQFWVIDHRQPADNPPPEVLEE